MSIEFAINIACIQMDVKYLDIKANLENMKLLIEKAIHQGSELIVFPELSTSGYMFSTKEEVYNIAQEIPNGESVQILSKIAKENNIYIVFGLAEVEGINLYNSAVIVGPDGYIGKYRKLHLWDDENIWFEKGNLGLPIFNTKKGKIGIAICYDIWFPEVIRLLSMQGADIICVPTNWIASDEDIHHKKNLATKGPIVCLAQSHMNDVYVVGANRVGKEKNSYFAGNSLIATPKGEAMKKIASVYNEEIIVGSCNLLKTRNNHSKESFKFKNDIRSDVYNLNLNYSINKENL